MRTLIALAAGAAVLLAAGVANAAEAKGKVVAINGNARTMKVDDKDYYFPTMTSMTGINVGDTVTLTFDAQNNRNVVTKAVK